MSRETLINETVVASIDVNNSGAGGSTGRQSTEFERIGEALRRICDSPYGRVFIVYGRAHQVVRRMPSEFEKGTYWTPMPDGGIVAQIVLALVESPAKRVRLNYKLVSAAGRNAALGWLTADCNPTTVLAGNNVHPATIADADTGEMRAFPSSDSRVMAQIYRVGFDLLEELHRQSGRSDAPLFDEGTRRRIRLGDIHIVRAQWCCYLRTADVSRFLQLIGVLYGHTIASGRTLVQIADHLCLCAEIHARRKNVPGVMLRKRHGEKDVFSFLFYDKRSRLADMRQGRSLEPLEAATVRDNVRFDITAHSLGIVMIVKEARRRLRALLKRGFRVSGDWRYRFLGGEVKPTVWWLEKAILVLSYRTRDGVLSRGSFAEWLVPHMLDKVLHLRVISTFRESDLRRLAALDDEVARAWRQDDVAASGPWAKRLAAAAGCSLQTVYARQKRWLDEFGIDIAAAYGIYRDVLFFGPNSFTLPEQRSALLCALGDRRDADVADILREVATDFDRRRRSIVGRAVSQRPLAMDVKVAQVGERRVSPPLMIRPA